MEPLTGIIQKTCIFSVVLISMFYFDPHMQDPFRLAKEFLILPFLAAFIMNSCLGIEFRKGYRIDGADRAWIAVIIFLLVNAAYSPYLKQIHYRFLITLAYLAMIPFLRQFFSRVQKPETVLGLFVISGLVSALYGILQYSGVDPFFTPVESFDEQRWVITGFIGQQTLFAGVLGPLLPVAIVLFFLHKSIFMKGLMLASGLAMIAAVTLTHTRAIFLGWIVSSGIILVLLLAFRHWKPAAIVSGITVFLFGGIYAVTSRMPTLEHRIRDGFDLKSSSVNARIHYWRASWKLIREKPLFGWGFGAFPFIYPEAQVALRAEEYPDLDYKGSEIVTHPHNEFILIQVEGGAMLTILEIWFLSVLFIQSLKNMISEGSIRGGYLRIACLGGLIILLVDAFFSFPTQIPASALLGISFIALLEMPPERICIHCKGGKQHD